MAIILSYIFFFVISGVGPIWRRYLANKTNPESLGQIDFAFKVMVVTVIFGLFIPIFSPFYINGNYLHLFLLALVSGVCGALYFISSYIAQKHVEAGLTTLIINIYTPVTIVLASIFLHEKLTAIQVVGTVILLFAMFLISKKHRIKTFHFDKYFLLMVAAGIFLGFVLVAERTLQKTTGFAAGTIFSWISQASFLGLAVLVTKSKHVYSKKQIAISGVISAVSSLAYVILVTVVGNLSVVSAVTTFKIVIIFILAAVFLKEREDLPRKILGSIIAVIGLLLMK
jgi:drug/metabolite transporter (DMT)-like permease